MKREKKIVHAYHDETKTHTLCGKKGSYASNNVHCTCKDCLKLLKRSCATCSHLCTEDNISSYVCFEGGFTEIGDINRPLNYDDCNAWEPVH